MRGMVYMLVASYSESDVSSSEVANVWKHRLLMSPQQSQQQWWHIYNIAVVTLLMLVVRTSKSLASLP